MDRLLLVDDEPQVRRVVAGLLEHHGYECIEAADADEARARLREAPVSLVLCDVNMPGMSGVQLVSYIRRTIPTWP